MAAKATMRFDEHRAAVGQKSIGGCSPNERGRIMAKVASLDRFVGKIRTSCYLQFQGCVTGRLPARHSECDWPLRQFDGRSQLNRLAVD